MCILGACANPTEPGVWWREDTQWKLYGRGHAQSIRNAVASGLHTLDLGTIASAVHPGGAHYTADLRNMVQTNVSSGQRRGILIIDRVAEVPSVGPAPPQNLLPSSTSRHAHGIVVHYRDALTGHLRQYDDDVASALLRAAAAGVRSLHVDVRNLDFAESVTNIVFSLSTMKQRNALTGAVTDFVIEVPWDPISLASLTLDTDKRLRRKLVRMYVESIRSQENLNLLLPPKAHPLKIVSQRRNPYLRRGHLLYERFLDCMENAMVERRDVFEAFTQSTKRRSTRSGVKAISGGANDPVQVGFHAQYCGTQMDSILKKGLGSTILWSTMPASVQNTQTVIKSKPPAENLASAGFKIIVFFVLILKDTIPDGQTVLGNKRALSSKENPGSFQSEFQLPVAEVLVQ